MSGPQVYFTWPTSFQLLPDNLPPTLPPPVQERTFRSPFGIDKDLYNFVLRPEVPIIFATVYIFTVFSVNAFNKSRGNKPWWIATTRLFQFFVVIHSFLLAIYSFATFYAMFRAIEHTWPGLDNDAGMAGVADALCKLHGPRGIGDAAAYNTTINIWEVKNSLIHLGYDGNPDPTDVGRLWNEGLAFWGWLFYMSKFYEVLDTFIIVSKGKRSPTLQTFHHAGALLCMWAGIRYMSPPIWMFVFINSGIHGMMYTYYTLSAIGIRVPRSLKRALTSLQILQFIFGASYAALHLFVQYDIPITTPYQVASTVQVAASSVSSAAVAAASSVSSFVESPLPTGSIIPLLKKLLLRAAGEEGVAERVHNDRGQLITPHVEEKIEQFNEQTFETHWRTDWTKVNCIDTTGEAFAIYLNLIYLAPLTILFARFFFKNYLQRSKGRTASQAAKDAAKDARKAEKQTEQAVESSGERIEDELARRGSQAKKEAQDLREQLREDVRRAKEGKYRGERRVSDRVASFERQVKSKAEQAAEKAKEWANGSGDDSRQSSPLKDSKEPRVIEEESEHNDTAVEEEADSQKETKSTSDTKSSDQTPKKESIPGDQSPKKEGTPGHPSVKKESSSGESSIKKESTLATQSPKKGSMPGSQSPTKASVARSQSPAKATAPANLNKSNTSGNGSPKKSSTPQSKANTSDEPKSKQDENISSSQATRPAAEQATAGANAQPAASSGTKNEPAVKQEANLADSQAIRPGASKEGDEELSQSQIGDTSDSMLKSGSIVDLGKETTSSVLSLGKETGDSLLGFTKVQAKNAKQQVDKKLGNTKPK